ncbi:MAG: hypothetical protein U9O96_02350, partial [Candidatus Thermoplasmatota archaeon]|nr:hypothetical protein [Candidatus Thermoplasmatota archaeon]
SKKVMEKIFDIERFGGTKRHYKLLTRGVQGNALMTVLGIQKILGYPLQIQSQNTLYTIDVVQNDLLGQYEIKIDRKKVENNGGLSIFLSIPPEAYVGDIDDMKNVFVNFIELNPQANLSFFTPDGNYIFKSNGYGNNRLDLGRNATTGKVIWFAKNDFFDRLRADARINPEMSVKNFIGEFYGL